MCNECWTAAQAIPAAAVVGRFAWVGYRERIGARVDSLRGRRGADPVAPDGAEGTPGPEPVPASVAAPRDASPPAPDDRQPEPVG